MSPDPCRAVSDGTRPRAHRGAAGLLFVFDPPRAVYCAVLAVELGAEEAAGA